MCNTRAWPQQCWRSCTNGSNIVVLRLGDHGTKGMLEVVDSKVCCFQTFCNNSEQHATTYKRVCNRIQGTYSSCNVRALVLLTFMGNVNKWQHLKICLLKCDKIWQKSCSYQTSVNEGLKTKVEQTSFVAYLNFSWKLFCQKLQKLFLRKYVFFPVTFLKKWGWLIVSWMLIHQEILRLYFA